MSESEEIGVVFKFFSKPQVAAIKITQGELGVGDTIRITGETTDLTQTVNSMEIDRVAVDRVVKGQEVGIKVKDRVRPNDRVYKVE